MAEKNEDVGYAPVPLMANSYDFQQLEAAMKDAEKASESERNAAFGKVVRDLALNQDVVEGSEQPALPEGTEMAEVTDQTGRETRAPVAIPDEDQPAPVKTTKGAKEPTDSETTA